MQGVTRIRAGYRNRSAASIHLGPRLGSANSTLGHEGGQSTNLNSILENLAYDDPVGCRYGQERWVEEPPETISLATELADGYLPPASYPTTQ